jgi:hypothetical protein
MNADLLDRLSDYRSTLEAAIAADVAQRNPTGRPPRERERGRRALVALAAASVVIIGVGALVWTSTRSSDTTPADRPPTDGIATTVEPVVTAVESAPTTEPVPTTTEALTTTNPPVDRAGAPAARIPMLAIGDPVMLGAAPALAEAGFAVDAVASRTFSDLPAVVDDLGRTGRLGDVVVIDAGTNGPIDEGDLVALFRSLFDVPTVIVLTVTGDRPWAETNNALIRSLPERNFPNVVVVDWAARAAECTDDCFYDDGIHLRPDGQAFYAALIAEAAAASARLQPAAGEDRTVVDEPSELAAGDWLIPSWLPDGYVFDHAQDNGGSRSIAYRNNAGDAIWIFLFDDEFVDGLPPTDGWEITTEERMSEAWLRLDDVRALVSTDALIDADVDLLLASLVPGDAGDVPGDILSIGTLAAAPPVATYEYAGLEWPMRATFANGRYCVEAAGGGGGCGLPIEPDTVLTLAAGGTRSSPGSTTVGVTSAGIVDDVVDRVEVEFVDGQRISVVPTDLTGAFDHEFWIVVTEVEFDEAPPPFDAEVPAVDVGHSNPIVAVTAYDAAGEVLAVDPTPDE